MLTVPNLNIVSAPPVEEKSTSVAQGQIYCITNNLNNMKYVGQTTCYKTVNGQLIPRGYEHRFEKHMTAPFSTNKETKNSCGKFYEAVRLHGREAFSITLLETCLCTEMNIREKYWIKQLKTRGKKGYNLTSGGQRPKRRRR